jgi:hypothetical protein
MESYPRAAVERAMITWAQAGEITKPDISCAMKSGHFNLLTTEPETEPKTEASGTVAAFDRKAYPQGS